MGNHGPGHVQSEHGVLGEARARSLLLNRFWVLERSVDVYGADFLIQRRLSDRNLGDRQRLGIVQVKYVQDGSTQLRIPQAYVVDDESQPRGEFFLLVCTGGEDNERMFLLSAAQVVDNFGAAVNRRGKLEFRSSAVSVLASIEWEVLDRRSALTRIEEAMARVDIAANRHYLGSLGYIRSELAPIDEEYLSPIQNSYGTISSGFDTIRKKAAALVAELEWVTFELGRLVDATDPIVYQAIYDRSVREHIDGRGQLSFEARDIVDGDLADAIALVQKYRARLGGRGVLAGFSALMETLRTRVGEAVDGTRGGDGSPTQTSAVHLCLDLGPGLRPLSVLASTHESPCEAAGSAEVRRLNEWFSQPRIQFLSNSLERIELCIDHRAAEQPVWMPDRTPEIVIREATWAVQSLIHEQLFADGDCPHQHPSGRLRDGSTGPSGGG